MEPIRTIGSVLLVWFALSATAAGGYDLAIDVPATLGGVDYTPNQVVRSLSGAYTARLTLPEGVALSAIHFRSDGQLVFAPAHSVTLGTIEYEARDLVRFDGTAYSWVIDGSAIGIPGDARIDAVFQDGAGNPIVSFDIPVQLGGVEYAPSSLIACAGGFSLYWDGPAAGIPASSNLVGADRTPDGALILSFDIPTALAGVDYLQGQLVSWQGGVFSLYASDAVWPAYAQLRDFSLLPPAGGVPDGNTIPGSPMSVSKSGAADVTLAWAPSCASTDMDYEVYEGTLSGSFDSHTPRLCTTGGATSGTFAPDAGDRYFLVVPRNAESEGSYGSKSDGSERPPAALACLPQQTGACL